MAATTMTANDAGPARTIELLWGLAPAPTRGPRRSLRLDQIVQQAVDIADAEGLDAVSMRRVAQELGVTTMSLYRYVPSKESLLELVADAGAGTPPPPEGVRPPWRAGLERWARAIHRRYGDRPWLLQIPITGPPIGPNNIAWMDSAITALEPTGLPPGEQIRVLVALSVYVRGEAQLGAGIAQAEALTGVSSHQREQVFGQVMASIADDPRFPALARMVRAGVFDEPDAPDADFEFGLQRFLDGVEALIERR